MSDDRPFVLTYGVFFVVAMVRANATYWLGRGARRGSESARVARYLDRPVVRRAETLIARAARLL